MKKEQQIARILAVINNIYQITSSKEARKSMTALAKEHNLSIMMSVCVKNALIERKLAFEKKNRIEWNMNMSEPNESMAESLYERAKEIQADRYYISKTEKGLSAYTDTQLVEELRKRNYNVVCSKMVKIEL